MSAAHAVNTFNNPKPNLLVRARGGEGIVATVEAVSLAGDAVRSQIAGLRAFFPEGEFDIDQSQVYYARKDLLGTA